jgi:predicted acyl esterase
MVAVRSEFPFAVRVVENFFVPLPDGIRLAARGWFPEGAGPVPAILEYLPYRKRDPPRHPRHRRQRGTDRRRIHRSRTARRL